MKPAHIFGIIVRVLGVLSWVAAVWRGWLLMYSLAHASVTGNGVTYTVISADELFWQHFIPTASLIALGFVMVRCDWLIRFSYPKGDHVA